MKVLTFFELFRGIVDHSGFSEYEIEKRMKKNCTGDLALLRPVHRSTINRIYREIDLPTTMTLYRIARYGLDQTPAQCAMLERLRKQAMETHTTSHHAATKAPAPQKIPCL